MARPQDEEDAHTKQKEDDAISTTDAASPEKEGLNPAQKAYWAVSTVWSYTMITAGIALSLGLLLNICGYAYQFSLERGLEIETIGRMKEINQFRSLENTRPPSSLPK